jgi:hypothetical protein
MSKTPGASLIARVLEAAAAAAREFKCKILAAAVLQPQQQQQQHRQAGVASMCMLMRMLTASCQW